jgi:type II restriction/modification system DNA methylase subunit YeeA
VAFDSGLETERWLNGSPVTTINPNLTTETDVTVAYPLSENRNICFQGTIKGGPFDLEPSLALRMLCQPPNVNGRPNSDVIHPWANASDIAGRDRGLYIIDFGVDMPAKAASLYEMPYSYVQENVEPKRRNLRREGHRTKWWIHAESRPGMRIALEGLDKYLVTPRHSKHRFFTFLDRKVLPDSALVVVTKSDDYTFGILSSHIHEIWARSQGTQVREVESGFRYTPNSCFDTFPFPYQPGTEPTEADSPIVRAIADAARKLVELRDAWLNPPGASDDDLKTRTLTKLYNARPEWLANAHRVLDEAVFVAYGWPYNLTDQEILARLLALNHERAAQQATKQ